MRSRTLRRALLAAVLLALSPLPAGAQGPAGAADLGAARERWAGMDATQREAVLERFRAFEAMSPEEREALRHRAHHVRDLRGRVRQHLPPPTRAELERLPPPERSGLLRDHVHRELGAIGRGFREELPPELRSELEHAGPDRWSKILRERGRRDRAHGLERMLSHLAAELDVAPDELQRVSALPPPERETVVLSWMRDSLVRKVESRHAELGELPPGIDEGLWQELLALPPDAFLSELRRLTGFGAFAPRRGGGGPGEGPGRGGARHGRGPERPRAPAEAATGEMEGPFLDPFSLDLDSARRMEDLHALRQQLRPGLAESLALRHLPPDERRSELTRQIRERVLAHLEATGLFAEELPALRALEAGAFVERVGELVRQSSRTLLRSGGRWRGGQDGSPKGAQERGRRGPRRGERPRGPTGPEGPGPSPAGPRGPGHPGG
jgi:hypothetical protein